MDILKKLHCVLEYRRKNGSKYNFVRHSGTIQAVQLPNGRHGVTARVGAKRVRCTVAVGIHQQRLFKAFTRKRTIRLCGCDQKKIDTL